MIKRLSISLVLMGLAVFALGAAAFAWFSDSGTADVSISAGDTDITFDVDRDCNGSWEADDQQGPFAFTWDGIVPGDTTTDCIVVNNNGDGDLDLFVNHQSFSGNADFRAALRFTYLENDGTTVICPPRVPDHTNYTTANSGRGCDLGDLAKAGIFSFRVKVDFVDDGTNQSALQNRNFGMDAVVTGYTG
jgi:predicted ribosomally synthesized peptide with SipW-like signal peptide